MWVADGGVSGAACSEVLKTKAQAIRLRLSQARGKVGRTVPSFDDTITMHYTAKQ